MLTPTPTPTAAPTAQGWPCTLLLSKDYECRLSLRPLTRPERHCELRITSVWAGARKPSAEQVRFQAVVDEHALTQLWAVLGQQLQSLRAQPAV